MGEWTEVFEGDPSGLIERDAHRLYLALMLEPERRFIVVTYQTERDYADGVMKILEGLYPGAAERVTIQTA